MCGSRRTARSLLGCAKGARESMPVPLGYPDTPADPVELQIGGVAYNDPYLWLEQTSPRTLAWQQAQAELLDAYLSGSPLYEDVRASLRSRALHHKVWAPLQCGRYWFRLEPRRDGMPALTVADEALGASRVLVDPNAMTREGQLGIDWFYPSPDGEFVVFGLSAGGDEQTVLHVVRTAGAELLPDTIAHATMGSVAWLPDGRGFIYTVLDGGSAAGIHTTMHMRLLGENSDAALGYPHPRDGFVFPQVSEDGRYVAGVDGFRDDRPSFLLDLQERVWRPFLRDHEALYAGGFVGQDYVAITTDGSPRGRVVLIPLETREDETTWRVLVPETEAVLLYLAAIGSRYVLAELVDVRMRLRVLDAGGTHLTEVPLPGAGVTGTDSFTLGLPGRPVFHANHGAETITFVYQSLVEAPAVYEYVVEDGQLRRLTEPTVDHPDWVQRQVFVPARDGALISVFMAEREGDSESPHSRRATVLHAYGGFNSCDLPNYFPEWEPFIEAGGRLAVISARGGCEFGRDWYLGGIMEHKHATFNDICDVAEWLISAGLTSSAQLALTGASNGGYTAAAAAVRRADLFRAVIPVVPVLDQMRVTLDPFVEAMGLCEEGTPTDPEHAARLFSLSPYHNVARDTVYPATLVIAGENDLRCPPWHSRKFVARLQTTAGAHERPMLLLVSPATGHFGITGIPSETWVALSAAQIVFVMTELGLGGDA